MPCSRIRRAASIGCVAGKRLFGCKSPARRFLSHIQTMADADTWVVVPCCQLLHACEDRGLPTDDGRCRPFKNGGIQDTHRPQGPCHLPARDIERLADFHSRASRPFARLRSHACSCIGTKRIARCGSRTLLQREDMRPSLPQAPRTLFPGLRALRERFLPCRRQCPSISAPSPKPGLLHPSAQPFAL